MKLYMQVTNSILHSSLSWNYRYFFLQIYCQFRIRTTTKAVAALINIVASDL